MSAPNSRKTMTDLLLVVFVFRCFLLNFFELSIHRIVSGSLFATSLSGLGLGGIHLLRQRCRGLVATVSLVAAASMASLSSALNRFFDSFGQSRLDRSLLVVRGRVHQLLQGSSWPRERGRLPCSGSAPDQQTSDLRQRWLQHPDHLARFFFRSDHPTQ